MGLFFTFVYFCLEKLEILKKFQCTNSSISVSSFFLPLLPLVKAPFWKILQFFHSLSMTYISTFIFSTMGLWPFQSMSIFSTKGGELLYAEMILFPHFFSKLNVGWVQVMQYGQRQKYCKKTFSKFWIKPFFFSAS